jgi:hypothetical protein
MGLGCTQKKLNIRYCESVERKIEDEKRIEGFLAKVDDARDPRGKKPIPAVDDPFPA